MYKSFFEVPVALLNFLLVFFLQVLIASTVLAQPKKISEPGGEIISTAVIDQIVEKLMDAAEVTGLDLGIINDNKPAYVKSYGYKNKAKNEWNDTATCSEFHHYGEAKDENSDFDNTRNSGEFKNIRLSIPYLRLESSPPKDSAREDSVYDFSEKLTDEKVIFKIDSTHHEDFSCLPVVVRASGKCGDNKYFSTISKLTIGFLEEHLKNINSFAPIAEQEMNKTIRNK